MLNVLSSPDRCLFSCCYRKRGLRSEGQSLCVFTVSNKKPRQVAG